MMRWLDRQPLRRLRQSLHLPTLEGGEQAARIQAFQKDVVMPIKGFVIVILVYYFYFSKWLNLEETTRLSAVWSIRNMFVFYLVANVAAAAAFFSIRRLSLAVLQWTMFTVGLLDALLFAALMLVTGGFQSPLYWVFLGLILHNSLSIPLATPQITLNLAVCLLYLLSGFADLAIPRDDTRTTLMPDNAAGGPTTGQRQRRDSGATNRAPVQAGVLGAARPFAAPGPRAEATAGEPSNPGEEMLLRLNILLLMSVCCYGLQALVEKQRRAEGEAEEFTMRQSQLEAAGRLAAEIAHKIKNPLGIINTAAFSLRKSLAQAGPGALEDIDIIREEVNRADRIITELMGYAQLAEGRVERLSVTEELDKALAQVFPPAARYAIEARKDYAPALPSLLMQRGHLSEIFVNLLQNAREAMNGVGEIRVSARYGENYTVMVTVADTGPGIPPEARARIFEPYFTTKKKGTGLGLAIVKHNVEIYGGRLRLESELGKGAAFTVQLPAKAAMRLSP